MQDLQMENARLQRIVDIVDSQPDLVFCTAGDGRITYLSERMAAVTKDFPAVASAEAAAQAKGSGGGGGQASSAEPLSITHINQLLSPESVQAFFEAINQLNHDDQDERSTSSVKVRYSRIQRQRQRLRERESWLCGACSDLPHLVFSQSRC